MTVPLISRPSEMSSYFCCFRLRQPLPAEIGGGIIGSMGNPESPGASGDTADASCTGVCEAGNSPTTAGGAVRLPIETPTPTAAVGAAPRALTALDNSAADAPKADSPSDRPAPISGATVCSAWAEVFCAA